MVREALISHVFVEDFDCSCEFRIRVWMDISGSVYSEALCEVFVSM